MKEYLTLGSDVQREMQEMKQTLLRSIRDGLFHLSPLETAQKVRDRLLNSSVMGIDASELETALAVGRDSYRERLLVTGPVSLDTPQIRQEVLFYGLENDLAVQELFSRGEGEQEGESTAVLQGRDPEDTRRDTVEPTGIVSREDSDKANPDDNVVSMVEEKSPSEGVLERIESFPDVGTLYASLLQRCNETWEHGNKEEACRMALYFSSEGAGERFFTDAYAKDKENHPEKIEYTILYRAAEEFFEQFASQLQGEEKEIYETILESFANVGKALNRFKEKSQEGYEFLVFSENNREDMRVKLLGMWENPWKNLLIVERFVNMHFKGIEAFDVLSSNIQALLAHAELLYKKYDLRFIQSQQLPSFLPCSDGEQFVIADTNVEVKDTYNQYLCGDGFMQSQAFQTNVLKRMNDEGGKVIAHYNAIPVLDKSGDSCIANSRSVGGESLGEAACTASFHAPGNKYTDKEGNSYVLEKGEDGHYTFRKE